MRTQTLSVLINGERRVADVPVRLTLVDWLRGALRLTGAHVGCEHGVCGACTVLVNGEAVRSCLMFACQADGADILTIEGLEHEGHLHALQEAFWNHHALQCGYCTPGMILSAYALLRETPHPDLDTIRSALAGNICRCTGYVQIVEAVAEAADGAEVGPARREVM